jgi:hypothetical protein
LKTQTSKSSLLRNALTANAIFSGISGIMLLVASKQFAGLLGLTSPSNLIGLGVSLIIYAAALTALARRPTINLIQAFVAVCLDAAWVVGSGALILSGVLSHSGNWLVALVADIVLVFAIIQFYGVRKMRPRPAGEPPFGTAA